MVETAEDETDDVTLPLMMALERLSPLERAAFLLHDVFGVGFDEVAETIGASRRPAASLPAARVPTSAPRGRVSRAEGARPGDRRRVLRRLAQRRHAQLRSLLAADVTVYADGGGKKPAARSRSSALRQL